MADPGLTNADVGDKGQRFVIRCHDWPRKGVNIIGWTDNLQLAEGTAVKAGMMPGCTGWEVEDRHSGIVIGGDRYAG